MGPSRADTRGETREHENEGGIVLNTFLSNILFPVRPLNVNDDVVGESDLM